MTVKELTSSSFDSGTLTINFGDATSMKAGTPYLVQARYEQLYQQALILFYRGKSLDF